MSANRSPLPRPTRAEDVTRLAKDSEEGRQALALFNASLGFDFSQVAEDAWWTPIRRPDGLLDVLLSADGVRVMARFAPRADAVEVTEQMIAEARRNRTGGAS